MKVTVGSKCYNAELERVPHGLREVQYRLDEGWKARAVIAIVVEPSGILFHSIDDRLVKIAIIENHSWGRGLNMCLVYSSQIETVKGCVLWNFFCSPNKKEQRVRDWRVIFYGRLLSKVESTCVGAKRRKHGSLGPSEILLHFTPWKFQERVHND